MGVVSVRVEGALITIADGSITIEQTGMPSVADVVPKVAGAALPEELARAERPVAASRQADPGSPV